MEKKIIVNVNYCYDSSNPLTYENLKMLGRGAIVWCEYSPDWNFKVENEIKTIVSDLSNPHEIDLRGSSCHVGDLKNMMKRKEKNVKIYKLNNTLMSSEDMIDGENILDYILTGEDLVPIGLKIEVYYNQYGISSGISKGYSEYYIIDKEISLNQLIKAVENNTDLKVYDGKIGILKNENDSDIYASIDSILCD